MKVATILLNLAKKIKTTLTKASEYTDSKLELVEITPTYINTSAVNNIICIRCGSIVFVNVRLKTGVSDQTTLAGGLPTPLGNDGVSTLSAFCMNAADISRDFMGFVQLGRLEVRATSTSTGASGIYLSGCYIAE